MAAKYLQALRGSGGAINQSSAIKAYQALADASPSEIHADAELAVHTLTRYIAAVQKSGYTPGTTPSSTQMAAIEGAAHQFQQPAVQSAIQHVGTWVQTNCKGVAP
jgi:hypothetical protein